MTKFCCKRILNAWARRWQWPLRWMHSLNDLLALNDYHHIANGQQRNWKTTFTTTHYRLLKRIFWRESFERIQYTLVYVRDAERCIIITIIWPIWLCSLFHALLSMSCINCQWNKKYIPYMRSKGWISSPRINFLYLHKSVQFFSSYFIPLICSNIFITDVVQYVKHVFFLIAKRLD